MVFLNDTKYEIEKLNLHDAEITKVFCDYEQKKVEIPLKLNINADTGENAILLFEGVHYMEISLHEPWGAGIYLNEVSVSGCTNISSHLNNCQPDDNCFCISILLNSGDKINIIALKVVYCEVHL